MNVFVELGRIKKPHKLVFQAGRMISMLVNAFRASSSSVKEEFLDWAKI